MASLRTAPATVLMVPLDVPFPEEMTVAFLVQLAQFVLAHAVLFILIAVEVGREF